MYTYNFIKILLKTTHIKLIFINFFLFFTIYNNFNYIQKSNE